ncbi:MAG: hypothetical protein INF44_00830 [Thalassospira sp.]|nr:hypothetical protein [Thalassospira sp.]
MAAVIVRLSGVWGYAYSGDEMLYLIMAQGDSLAEIWRRGLAELHPPLAHIIRHYLLAFGDSAALQRFFSLCAEMGALAGAYALGYTLRGRGLALAFVLLMAFMPESVISAGSIRNYAFFMLFALWGMVFYARYHMMGQRLCDAAIMAALFFLAGATHFTGFFLVAVCGLCEVILRRRKKQYRRLCLYTALNIPLLLLGLFLYSVYWAPGGTAEMWRELAQTTGFMEGNNTEKSLLALFFGQILLPIKGLLLLGETYNISDTVAVFMFLATLGLAGWYLIGIWRIVRSKHWFAVWLACLWCVALAVILLGVYPGTSGRHYYFMLPGFLVPLAWLLQKPIQRLTQTWARSLSVSAGVLIIAGVLFSREAYLAFDADSSLRNEDLAAGQRFLQSHVAPGDIVFAGRLAGYYYVLYEMDQGKTPYDLYADVPYFNGSRIVAPFNPVSKPHRTIEPFYAQLKHEAAASALADNNSVWFVTYSYRNIEMEKLLDCPEFSQHIDTFFSRQGVMLFSIRAAGLREFLEDTNAWGRCFADYKPLIAVDTIPQRARPQP